MSRSVRRLALLPALASLALAAACTTVGPGPVAPLPPRPPVPQPPSATEFRARDFAWSQETGGNVVAGAVAYRTKARGAFTCAGSSIGLTPATPLTEKRIVKLYGSTERAVDTVEKVRERSAGEAAPAWGDYVRTAQCDAKGKFSFAGLPDGAWFLVVRARPVKGAAAQGVVIMRRVDARGGVARTLALD